MSTCVCNRHPRSSFAVGETDTQTKPKGRQSAYVAVSPVTNHEGGTRRVCISINHPTINISINISINITMNISAYLGGIDALQERDHVDAAAQPTQHRFAPFIHHITHKTPNDQHKAPEGREGEREKKERVQPRLARAAYTYRHT